MSNPRLRIVLAQLNFTVGDLVANTAKHLAAAYFARDILAADVVVFPELSLVGYLPEDLLLRHDFITAAEQSLQQLLDEVPGIVLAVGHPWQQQRKLYNACSLIDNHQVIARYAKCCLPNTGVFDERRYFTPGRQTCLVSLHNVRVGWMICEDIWHARPVSRVIQQGAQLIIAMNASPFEINKHEQRINLMQRLGHKVPMLYVNHVGGQDDLIFDGGSFWAAADGQLGSIAGFFVEVLSVIDVVANAGQPVFVASHIIVPWDAAIPTRTQALPQHSEHALDASVAVPEQQQPTPASQFRPAAASSLLHHSVCTDGWHPANSVVPDQIERVYRALVLSLADYVRKNRFQQVILGLSGGIDSALTLCLAVDALSAEQVLAVLLPSRYTTAMSLEDAAKLTQTLAVPTLTLSIEPAYEQCLVTLAPWLSGELTVTEENIQARLRAVLLMALSNQRHHLVLTTSNRSELAVGYCTLSGDMAGGFAVLKDVPKTLVYQLSVWRNAQYPVIPERILTRPASAELRPQQQDTDHLPPYSILDPILAHYLNDERSAEQIIAIGFDPQIVVQVLQAVQNNEYKRKQVPVGPRINHRAFGKDRRYPITNGFRG